MRPGQFVVILSVYIVCHSFCTIVCRITATAIKADFSETSYYAWPTNRKNWLTFRADPVPDTDSGIWIAFPLPSILQNNGF